MRDGERVVQAGRGGHRLLAAALLGVVTAGCVAVVPHEPNLRIVDELGPDESARRLQEVLNRAVEPRITSVEVAADYVRYQWEQPMQGPYWVTMGAVPREVQVYFANLEKVEVYENANVFIHGLGGRIDKILFANLDDAKLLSDFLLAYRARRGAPVAPPPPAPMEPTAPTAPPTPTVPPAGD